MFHFLQLPNEDKDLAQFAVQSLNENFGYKEEINKNKLQLDNMVNLKQLTGTIGDVVCTKNKALFEPVSTDFFTYLFMNVSITVMFYS